jgi:hypothetical protein
MDSAGNGLGRRARGSNGPVAGATLKRVTRSGWFWVGWACLMGALTGWADLVSPGVQFLLIGGAIVAFHRISRADIQTA